MTRVKICGIREEAHVRIIAEAGGDFIGVVFAPSRRQVTPEQARRIADAVKDCSRKAEVVGVFVNMPAAEVNRLAGICNLDWVQLSGDEPWEYCRQITRPLIKAVRIGHGRDYEDICADLRTGAELLSDRKCLYLLDSRVEDEYGGTGTTFDWNLAQRIASKFPVVLAGGLTPENVAQAVGVAAPWGVDVSSGVEVSGVKDAAKIRAFIGAVRGADGKKR
jgi:phosphoribosylanthranilate isomerase